MCNVIGRTRLRFYISQALFSCRWESALRQESDQFAIQLLFFKEMKQSNVTIEEKSTPISFALLLMFMLLLTIFLPITFFFFFHLPVQPKCRVCHKVLRSLDNDSLFKSSFSALIRNVLKPINTKNNLISAQVLVV